MAEACRVDYRSVGTYLFWGISFVVVSLFIRLAHETFHNFFTWITNGSWGTISIGQWILFYPVFTTTASGGNPFWNYEGTLFATFLLAMAVVLITSPRVLSSIVGKCESLNLSGWLFGATLAGLWEMWGVAVYSLPNFVFYETGNVIDYGDGTVMSYVWKSIGYSPELQYVISFMLFIACLFITMWVIRCHPEICDRCAI